MATLIELPLIGARRDDIALRLKLLEERLAETARQEEQERWPLPKAGDAPETVPASACDDLAPLLAADFDDDELDALPIVKPGKRLRSGETYLDLSRPGRPFEAMGTLTALASQRLVPKSQTDPTVWRRLAG